MKALGLVVGAFLLFIGYVWLIQYREVNRSREADQEFEKLIQDAKEITANPCGLHLVRLVQPPEHATQRAVLVIGGEALSEGNVHDLAFEAREPAPGEHVVRVAIEPAAPEFQEIIWIANETKACEAGLSKQIRGYTISGGRSGGYSHGTWPAPRTK